MGEGALKLFLDCGAHDGSSVRLFRERYPDWREWKVHCFEPNPMFRLSWNWQGVQFHEEAVWVDYEVRPFYLHCLGKPKAGSLMATKQGLDLRSPLMVHCIDFGEWVTRNSRRDDHIVLKMDIEGAEYRVLPHMIADGSIEYVDELYVEFHGHKTGIASDVHDALIADIRSRGFEPKTWRA